MTVIVNGPLTNALRAASRRGIAVVDAAEHQGWTVIWTRDDRRSRERALTWFARRQGNGPHVLGLLR